jgi:hypothetical protein
MICTNIYILVFYIIFFLLGIMQQVYGAPTSNNVQHQHQPPQQVASMPRIENISCVFPATEHMGGLYIGNYFGAINTDILKEYGIRAVLTTSVETRIILHVLQLLLTRHNKFRSIRKSMLMTKRTFPLWITWKNAWSSSRDTGL